jgi:hypothetical protein
LNREPCAGLVIHERRFRCEPHSDASNPQYKLEEDVYNAAVTLEYLRKRGPQDPKWVEDFKWSSETWQNWMMYMLKPVARHYGVDDSEVLALWTRHYVPGILARPETGNSA